MLNYEVNVIKENLESRKNVKLAQNGSPRAQERRAADARTPRAPRSLPHTICMHTRGTETKFWISKVPVEGKPTATHSLRL